MKSRDELMVDKWNKAWGQGQNVRVKKFGFHIYTKTYSAAFIDSNGDAAIFVHDVVRQICVALKDIMPVSLKAVESNYTHDVNVASTSITVEFDSNEEWHEMLKRLLMREKSGVKYEIVREDIVEPSEKKDPRIKFYIDGIEFKGVVDLSYEPVHFSAIGKQIYFSRPVKKGAKEKINKLMKTYNLLYTSFDGKIPDDVLDLWYEKCLELV